MLRNDVRHIHTDTAHVDHVNEGLANARPNNIYTQCDIIIRTQSYKRRKIAGVHVHCSINKYRRTTNLKLIDLFQTLHYYQNHHILSTLHVVQLFQ